MEQDFWHAKWKKNEIAFHQSTVNPLLAANWNALALPAHSRVFLPLCGKTLDIPWLLSQGYRVAGAELSALAIRQLFDEMDVVPAISRIGNIELYSAEGLDVYVGDIFDLSADVLGPIDAVYDRAALVALPPDMRRRYAAHLVELTKRAPQLLITYEYDQTLQPGPPFSVARGDINQYYADLFESALLASAEVPGGLKGKCPAAESVWLLRPHPSGTRF